MIKRLFGILIVFLFAFSAGSLAVSQTETDTDTITDTVMEEEPGLDLYSQVELFSYTLTTIQSEYVDQKKPKDLIYGSLKGMLSSLDPHSQFLSPDEYQELKTETEGRFGGLGIEISIRDGLLTIVSPVEDTPAWRAGIKAGDRIVKIEDELTRDITLNDAVKKLRGEPGTSVDITVLREDEFKLLDFTIVREIIQVEDIKDTQILEDHIGYVRLTEFREDSHKGFQKAMENLRAQGADSLIFDLRNNPGGLLNVAIDITDDFLPEGDIIVTTKGRRASQSTESFAEGSGLKVLDWPLVVLVNEGSASGSAILAGAVKDNKRAVILGTKSFGKGSVQSVIPLPDGSALRLTTSKYFTPSGVSIHGTGITPDIIIEPVYPEEEEEEAEKNQKDTNVKKIFEDIKLKESENPEDTKQQREANEARERLLKDNQVQSAISVIKGIKVYKQLEASKTKQAAVKPEAAGTDTGSEL